MRVRHPAALLLALAFASLASAQPAPKGPKDRTLCDVSQLGIVRCVRPTLLKEELSPGLVKKLQELADKIWSEYALAGTSDTAYRCGVGEWKSKKLSLGSATAMLGVPTTTRKQRPTVPSASDRTSMVSECQASLRASVAAGGFGAGGAGRGSRASWISSSVGKMDKAVAGCQDDRSRNSMIAWKDTPGDLLDKFDAAKGNVKDHFDRESLEATVRVISHQIDENRMNYFEAAAAGDKDKKDALEREKEWLMGLLKDITKEAEQWPKGTLPPGAAVTPGQPPPSPPPANPTPLGPAPTPGRNPTGVPTNTGSPCRDGADCKPSCEQIQAQWAAFKEYCEQSDWQVYRCEAFLRKLNGCVDPALINPGPDGDLTCPERATTDKKQRAKLAYLAACEKRKMIATPIDNGGMVCIAPELDQLPVGIDLCNDPRVMPGPDQCPGAVIPMEDPNPKPQPDPRG
jgi:hypothetical protein